MIWALKCCLSSNVHHIYNLVHVISDDDSPHHVEREKILKWENMYDVFTCHLKVGLVNYHKVFSKPMQPNLSLVHIPKNIENI